jgi:hypothetical protein
MLERLDLWALTALVVLAGVLAVACFLPRGARWSLSLVFAAVFLGAFLTGWLGLVLAEFNWFSRGPLLAGLAVFVVLAALWRWWAGRAQAAVPFTTSGEKVAAWEWVMLGVWLVAASWLFFRPHEYIYGGADAGVYVSLGAEIARNGGFHIGDETLAEMDPALRAAVLRPLPNTPGASAYLLPGFYVTDEAAGVLTPQFYPLHPVWQAIAFSVSGGGASGMRAELLLTGLWMLLGTLAVYLTAREVAGPFVAALLLAALSVSALQIWFGRYPTSEALTQFMLWTGIWSAARWQGERTPANLWAFIAGCAFGAVFLVRIDSIILLPVLSLFLIWRWARGWQRADAWFAVPLTVLAAHSLLHGHFLSAPYFYETLGYGFSLLSRLWPLSLAALIACALALWWLPTHTRAWHLSPRPQRLILAAVAAAFLAYALYGWFIRPALYVPALRPDVFSGGEIPVLNHENWPRLGWYMAPLGVWLGVIGFCLMLLRLERRTVLGLLLGLLFSFLYLWNISANPHHIYVMRRYVPAVMPLFLLAGAYLLGERGFGWEGWRFPSGGLASKLPYSTRLILLGTIVALWLAGLGWAARGFVSQVDHAGLVAQVDQLAGRLPNEAVLLFDDQAPISQGDVWGTPLRFVYGYDVFTLRQPPAQVASPLAIQIETWQNNDRPVVWIGATDWLDRQGYRYQSEQVTLTSQRLESSYDHKPQAIITETVTLLLSYLESN